MDGAIAAFLAMTAFFDDTTLKTEGCCVQYRVLRTQEGARPAITLVGGQIACGEAKFRVPWFILRAV